MATTGTILEYSRWNGVIYMGRGKGNPKKDPRPFSERHPHANLILGLFLLLSAVAIAVLVIILLLNLIKGAFSSLSAWFATFSKSTEPVIIVALITGAVSIVGVMVGPTISKAIEYKRERREYLAKKREEPYSKFIDFFYTLQEKSKAGEDFSDDINDMVRGFSQKLTLWGSNKVIKKWLKFRESSNESLTKKDGGIDNLFVLEEIMFAMRKDMGLKKLSKGNLLQISIPDIKNYKKNK